jgi:hypothetical protein
MFMRKDSTSLATSSLWLSDIGNEVCFMKTLFRKDVRKSYPIAIGRMKSAKLIAMDFRRM